MPKFPLPSCNDLDVGALTTRIFSCLPGYHIENPIPLPASVLFYPYRGCIAYSSAWPTEDIEGSVLHVQSQVMFHIQGLSRPPGWPTLYVQPTTHYNIMYLTTLGWLIDQNNYKYCFDLVLEGMARYAGQLLAPSAYYAVLAHFRPFLVFSSNLSNV